MTTQTKHTQGPWKVGLLAIMTGVVEVGDRNGKRICSINSLDYSGTMDTIVPNARLIAAAPELLQIARYASEISCVAPDSCLHCDAVSAIAKAEGGQ